MELLVAYDVQTTDRAGRKRLRKMAEACQAYGMRVQNSVFECKVNEVQIEQLLRRLEKIVDKERDSLRIYRLREPKTEHIRVMGRQLTYDLNAELII